MTEPNADETGTVAPGVVTGHIPLNGWQIFAVFIVKATGNRNQNAKYYFENEQHNSVMSENGLAATTSYQKHIKVNKRRTFDYVRLVGFRMEAKQIFLPPPQYTAT